MRKEMDLPPGYRTASRDALTIAVKEGYAKSFENFVMPEVGRDSPKESAYQGRSGLFPVSLADHPAERALIRRCVRGGVLGRILRETYLSWGEPRPLEELRVSEYARSLGIATPEVLAVAFRRVPPFFYRGAVATREIGRSTDLQARLCVFESPADRTAIRQKRRAIISLAQLIARMHAAGIYHADLHLKNVLLVEGEECSEPYLLDLDAARVFRPLSDFRICMNLLRLFRSVQKVNRRRAVVTRTDVFRFMHVYAKESSRSVRALIEKLDRLSLLWRLKWKLSDMIGA